MLYSLQTRKTNLFRIKVYIKSLLFWKPLMAAIWLRIRSKLCLLCLRPFVTCPSDFPNIISDYYPDLSSHARLLGVPWTHPQDSPSNIFVFFLSWNMNCLASFTFLLKCHFDRVASLTSVYKIQKSWTLHPDGFLTLSLTIVIHST